MLAYFRGASIVLFGSVYYRQLAYDLLGLFASRVFPLLLLVALIGGGLGIDYDGTSTTSDSSRNYSTEEYVADVVWGVKQICDLEQVPHPNLVSESGRAMTAHHSCVVTNIVGEMKPAGFSASPVR